MTELNKLPLVLVPCGSGAPWDIAAFPQWSNRQMITGQLPNAESMDEYADIVSAWTNGIGDYVLIGDSFGASVALLLAERQPAHLKVLVLSGGFAKADVALLTRLRVAANVISQRGYPSIVKMYARMMSSHFDPPGTDEEIRQLHLKHCNPKTFVKRTTLVLKTDLRPGLGCVKVPTLLLTPEDDRLIGPKSACELKDGITLATEHVMKGTGHLLRFTNETDYAEAVDRFLEENSRSTLELSP
ncbi:MAG: alpha/beta fold hydrolase [Halobacteriota archaeon]